MISLREDSRIHSFEVGFGACLLSLSPVFVAAAAVHPTAMAFYRVAIGGVLMGIAAILKGDFRGFGMRHWAFATLAGISLGLDLIFWHVSIKYVGPGLATLLANFQVVVLSVIGIAAFHERPTARFFISLSMALVGLAIIVAPRWEDAGEHFQTGILFGFLTALTYSCYLIGLSGVHKSANPPGDTLILSVVSLISSALIGGYALVKSVDFRVPDLKNLAYVSAYGALCQGLGWLLISRSMPKVPLSLVGILLLLQPLLAYVWDVIFFAKPLSLAECAGAVLAVVGIYFGSTRLRAANREPVVLTGNADIAGSQP